MSKTPEQDGTSDQFYEVTLSHVELRALERKEWERKWLKIAHLDRAIQKVIEQEHCKKYCGLIKVCVKDYKDCAIHHDELYRRYLEALGKPELADVIAGEFRWEKLL